MINTTAMAPARRLRSKESRARAARDPALNHRRGDHPVVQDDGQVLPNVAACEFLELLGARPPELEGDDGLAGVDLAALEPGPGIAQVRAGNDDPLLQGDRLLLGT